MKMSTGVDKEVEERKQFQPSPLPSHFIDAHRRPPYLTFTQGFCGVSYANGRENEIQLQKMEKRYESTLETFYALFIFFFFFCFFEGFMHIKGICGMFAWSRRPSVYWR